MPKIELIKVLRDCPFNTRPENSRRLVRDVKVVIDGEHRATWCRRRNHYELKHALESLGDIRRIPGRGGYTRGDVIECRKFADAERLILENLDLIPTLAMYPEMERAENEKTRLALLGAENRKRAMKIAAAAPALRNALQSLVAVFARHDGCSRYCVGDAAVLRDAEELLRTLPPPTEPIQPE